mmetsp:Transcript_77059/g.229625  ORF Transcript_77059/g.229625 Transcript_77059/m.229625 type:complete len:221 (-) Transcript_77059:710-1372(-)
MTLALLKLHMRYTQLMGWTSCRRPTTAGAKASKKARLAKPTPILPWRGASDQAEAEARWNDQKQASRTSESTLGSKSTIAWAARSAMRSRKGAATSSDTCATVKAQRSPLRLPSLLSRGSSPNLGVTASATAARADSEAARPTARAHATSASCPGENSSTRGTTTSSATRRSKSSCGDSSRARSQIIEVTSRGGNFSGECARAPTKSSAVAISPHSLPRR